ncbi:unnamed protein product [Durusdinium trenchii]|uniref:protein-tyrosine-phosphatase n=2 Tax=Durusdinium trenchii TaxID=1381693 RepID=A0ABP0J6U2_9DINO
MYIHIYIHIQRSQALHTMGNVMGNIVLKKLTPAELYNKLQDTRELLLVVDVDKEDHADDVGEILETTELNFMSPQLCKRLLRKVMVNRRARGWTIAVLGREGRQARAAEGLYKWISANGFGFTRDETKRSDSLVKEVCELAGSTEDFYRSFPFLHEGHPFFELGRLYPSLVATADDGRVFLSNFGVASDPHTYHALGIHYVVNCSRDLPFVDDVVSTLRSKPRDKSSSMLEDTVQKPIKADLDVQLAARLRVPVDDSSDVQISEHFAASVRFIEESLQKKDGHVLIHCKHGQSRSATIAAAYLLHKAKGQSSQRATVDEVLAELKNCRPRASPNLGFLRQLHEFSEGGDSETRID